MVHRALFGSVERFFGILIEHYAGAFPVWLAPVQAAILPITDKQAEYAHQVGEKLKSRGRARQRGRPERESEPQNPRCAAAEGSLHAGGRADARRMPGQVAVRHRKRGDLGPTSVEEFVRTVTAEIAAKTD